MFLAILCFAVWSGYGVVLVCAIFVVLLGYLCAQSSTAAIIVALMAIIGVGWWCCLRGSHIPFESFEQEVQAHQPQQQQQQPQQSANVPCQCWNCVCQAQDTDIPVFSTWHTRASVRNCRGSPEQALETIIRHYGVTGSSQDVTLDAHGLAYLLHDMGLRIKPSLTPKEYRRMSATAKSDHRQNFQAAALARLLQAKGYSPVQAVDRLLERQSDGGHT